MGGVPLNEARSRARRHSQRGDELHERLRRRAEAVVGAAGGRTSSSLA
jgi:hypothetical protein